VRDVWDIPQPEIQSQSGASKTSQSLSQAHKSSGDAPRPQGAQTSNAADDVPTSRPQAQKDMGNTSNTDQPFMFVPEEQETSPDVGRLVELDEQAVEPAVEPAVEGDSQEFITDPMRPAGEVQPVEIEQEEAPVVTERKTEPAEQELVVPVVVSRSQVRKTISLKLRLEIRVVDD